MNIHLENRDYGTSHAVVFSENNKVYELTIDGMRFNDEIKDYILASGIIYGRREGISVSKLIGRRIWKDLCKKGFKRNFLYSDILYNSNNLT